MTINPNLGYELGPGRSYNSIERRYPDLSFLEQDVANSIHLQMMREHQAHIERYIMEGMMIPPSLICEYQKPIIKARTNMKNWLRVLQDDIHTNHTRINALETEPQQPLPTEDAKLMKLELHLRKALADILTQRTCTEAAKQALK